MTFGAFATGAMQFLGSAAGQQLISTAGQVFKVKELGWQPGATAVSSGVAQPPGVMPGAPVLGLPAPGFPETFPGQPATGGGVIMANNPINQIPMMPSGVAGDPFGGRFVDVPKKFGQAWDQFSGMATQPVDVINLGQYDDKEVAKLAMTKQVIPADSDLGLAAQAGGAKVETRSVRMSDGTSQRMRVIAFKGARTRRRRNYATKAGIRNAARTLRQMGQITRTYKSLAKLGAKIDGQLSPKRRASGACCPPKRAPARRKAC